MKRGQLLLAGRYVLDRELGRGGMAIVHEGHDRRLDRRVAIKLVPVAATEPTARHQFVREARSTARLSHPNAVAVFDAGDSDGYLYIVMEFVGGRTLAEELSACGRIEPTQATAIALSVLAALDHAHRTGIVHRDVKPSNIMLSHDGTVKLLDFGIAKRLDDLAGSVTNEGGVVGTPKYLAPEQVAGRLATPASDLYAVGVVLFEMLAGAPPFDGDSPIGTALAHAVAPVPDVSSVRHDLPATLVRAVDKALAKDPADRFTTALEMRNALTANPTNTASGNEPLEPTMRMPPPPELPDLAGASERTPAPSAARAPESTQVLAAEGYRRRRPAAWWLLGVAALVVVAGVLIWAVSSNDPGESAAAPTTTSVAVTTTIPTTTLDGVIAALQANPADYGPHAGEIIDELAAIQRGDNPNERAAALLEQVTTWVDAGEATPATLSMLETVLTPLIESASANATTADGGNGGGNGNGGENGNGGGNGNGNGNGNGKKNG